MLENSPSITTTSPVASPLPTPRSMSLPSPPPIDTGRRSFDGGLAERTAALSLRPNSGRSFTEPFPMRRSSSPSSPLNRRNFSPQHASFGSPSQALPPSPFFTSSPFQQQPRNRSPFSRSHLRARSSFSSTSSSNASQRARADSLPISDVPLTNSSIRPTSPKQPIRPSSPMSGGRRPVSPLSFSARRSSPLRRPMDESSSFSGVDIDQTISENQELDIPPRPVSIAEPSSASLPNSPYSLHATFPRTRRRPSSPLRFPPVTSAGPAQQQQQLQQQILSPPMQMTSTPTRLHTSSSSPTLRSPTSPASSAKYNEAFPGTPASAAAAGTAPSATTPSYPSFLLSTNASISSVPSTPTSFRSRSPSISSLETIPDSPDAEEAAVEQAERDRERDAVAKLRAAMEREKAELARGRGRTLGRGGDGFGLGGGIGGGDKRKRWSVCGAERRGDLDLETIYEV